MLIDLADATGHQQLLKRINRMALVRHLCVNPALSRADLATAVGLTKSTVSMLVRELIDEGWLQEREVVVTGDRGRRPTPLFIDPTRMLLLGAEVGVGVIRIVATSLTGDVLATHQIEMDARPAAPEAIHQLAQGLSQLHQQLQGEGRQVIGIGVGLPGGVDEATGVLRFAPNLGWRDLAIGPLLAAELASTALNAVPLYLQNEADVAAVGEMEFNATERGDPLIYVSINEGVGAGVIVDDRLLTGHRGFAGEVGHIVLQIDGPRCSCGRLGCAEALIGLSAMSPTRAEGSQTRTMTELKQRLQVRDTLTLAAVHRAGNYLGVLLHNLCAAYDPACIVLGGTGVTLGDDFTEPALQTLAGYAEAAKLPPPNVRISRFGADAVAVGAAALARYRLTRPLIAPNAVARGQA